MSCTIFYKGILKENTNTSDVLDVISKHMQNLNAELIQSDEPIIIQFLCGKSEPLVFHFKNRTIDGFCKWNGEKPEEFYAIFDMFIELKPLFKSLKIEDDDGLWHEYVIQKQPCKIKLRPLTSDEMNFLRRVKMNETTPPDEIEQFVISKSGLKPISFDEMQDYMRFVNEIKALGNNSYQFEPKSKSKPFYHALLRIIVQDFIKIMMIESIDDFKPRVIIDIVKKQTLLTYYFENEDIRNFDFSFHRMLMLIWISSTFEYKKMGVVKDLTADIRGLESSLIAAIWGITSIFLNKHIGGSNNSKEAEMYKLAKKYYKTGALGEVMVIDKPERELEFFFSMMDYLGFNYVGVE